MVDHVGKELHEQYGNHHASGNIFQIQIQERIILH